MEIPKISIIVPVLNAADFIDDCLKSIISQNYPNLELIVMDGGSNDGTAETIKKYSDKIHYWESKPDEGQSNAINKGFRVATGDIIAWLNADEEYMPGVLNKVGKAFLNEHRLDFVYGNRAVYDASGNYVKTVRYAKLHPFRLLVYGNYSLPSDASFWSKRVHEFAGELDETLCQHLCMDTEWFRRISSFIDRYRYFPETLSKFKEHCNRKTPDSNSQDDRFKEFYELSSRIRSQFRNKIGFSKARMFWGWLFWCSYIRIFQQHSLRLPKVRALKRIFKSAD